MKKILILSTICMLLLGGNLFAQPNIFDPNDPIVTYNSANPPATPPANTMAKWVRTVRMGWNTSRFKCYYWNGMVFRLRFPNNYNPADLTKKYPAIVFFHGAGENAPITDNEYHLIHGAQRFESAMNAGQFDAFMIFPQVKNGTSWDYFYYSKINNILDSLQKYCKIDMDRVISMGLSSGGFASLAYTADFPERSSTVIASSPALIRLLYDRQDNFIHVPVWASSGGRDANPDSTSMKIFVDSFVNKGGDIRWTFFPTLGHLTWNEQWDQPYLFPYWNAAHKANPLIFYKRNQFCSDSSIDARLGITGGFFQYQWQKDNVDLVGSNSNEIIATQFGSYRARFKRFSTSAWSDWSTVPAVISPRPASATPPIQITGIKSKVLPSADGSTTVPLELPAGYLAYEWRRTSDNALVSTQRTFEAPVGSFKGLIAGCSRTFSPVFTVINANGNPKPDPAQNLTITRLNPTSVQLNWTDVALPVNDETGFEIYRGTTAGGPYSLIFINPANVKSFTDQNAGSFNYYYRIRSINNTGAAALSNEVTLQPPSDNIAPTTPANLKVVLTGRNSIDLDWDNSTDNIGVTSYDVYVNNVKKYTTTVSDITADNLLPNTVYTFTVKALDQAGNASGFSNAVSDTTIVNGLKYRYYEGTWNTLPNFNTLSPVKTGMTPNITLADRTSGVNDNYGFVWEGYINIVTPGNYTFELISDDGSKFYYNSFYSPTATALVNNDGIHGPVSVAATVNITESGLYPIAITFFEKNSGESMQIYWTGPGITRQLIPNSAFTENYQPPADNIAPSAPANLRAVFTSRNFIDLDWDNSTDNIGVVGYDVYVNNVKTYTTSVSNIKADNLTPNTSYTFTVKARDLAGNISANSNAITSTSSANGLKYNYYQGDWDVLPNFGTLTPVKTGSTPNIDMSVRNSNEYFGFVWEGYINLPTAGNYTFELISDDGSKLYFNSFYSHNATALVNNDGLHGPNSVSGTVNAAAAGLYPIAITFFEKHGGEAMEVYWSGPGITKQLIPNAAFTENYQPPADNIAPSVPANLRAVFINSTFIDLDWDNSTDNVGVAGYDVYVNNVKKYTTTVSNISADSLTANTSYTFTVKARDHAGNTSGFSNAVTAKTTNAANGLQYRYYEGDWDALPNFSTLTPVKTGSTPNIDMSVRNVNDFFGFVWEGSISIPTAGLYTFELISDDGSKLYFNSLYSPTATALVNNDGLHGPKSVSGTVNVTATGLYPIAITFFEKWGGETMEIYWTGPGISRQLIPDAAFTGNYQPPADNIPPTVPANLKALFINNTFIDLDWDNSTDNVGVTGYDVYVNNVKQYTSTVSNIRANNLTPNTSYTFTVKALDQAGNASASSNAVTAKTTNTATGLNYRYYEGDWDVLPNFNALTPVKTGVTPNIDMSVRNVNDYFGFVWEGNIKIPTAGSYTFEIISDDGSKLYFNSLYSPTATALVNNDGLHGPNSVSGTVNIATAGLYPIAITFFEKWGGETMQVYWTGPGIPRQLIPDSAFTEGAVVPSSINAGNLNSSLVDAPAEVNMTEARDANASVTDAGNRKITKAYPNPFIESLNVEFYNTGSNRISVGIYDLSGKLVQNHNFGNLPAGNTSLKFNLSTQQQINSGVYVVRLNINGVPLKIWKMIKEKK